MHCDAVRSALTLPSGLEIALLDWGGGGPPALLHHANGFCAGLWQPVAEGLRGHFHCFGMDARGHGDSSAPEDPEAYGWEHFAADAGAVADQLAERCGAPLALGLGHSFGGTALLLAAVEKAARFGRLVLVDPIVLPSGLAAEKRRPRQNAMAARARRRRDHWPSREVAVARLSRREMFRSWAPGMLELYAHAGLRERADGRVELKCRPAVEASVFERGASVDAMERARGCGVPTRILWARRGNFPREHFENLARALPQGSLADADAGHLVPMEDPERVVREVLGYAAP